MPSRVPLLRLPLLVFLLVLSGLLLGAGAARAATAPATAAASSLEAFSEEEGEGEGEAEETECETAEEEVEEGELAQDEADKICKEEARESRRNASGPGAAAPKECILRSAHAHASESHDRLKVTVGYTAGEPTGATIEVRSGHMRLASTHHHLGRSGVLRITKNLGRKKIDRIVVRFRTPSCSRFQTKSVKVG